MSAGDQAELDAYYERGEEQRRLGADAVGVLEFERTKEIISRRLPPAPAVIADIGGGPGRYTLWLAGLGYQVEHRDLMPLHVQQLAEELSSGQAVRTRIGDARQLDLPDSSADAVLMLGPIYHLRRRADRLAALREAARIVQPGGPVFVAAISRWAPRLDGTLRSRMYLDLPQFGAAVTELERVGWMPAIHPGAFTAYFHRPGQLRQEVRAAGLRVADLVSVEGAAYLLGDLADRLADPADAQVLFEVLRATERVPELLGLGSHLIATAVRT
jgi:SAM-dependent methyltransferase